jgi:hypothetical protein
MLLVLLSAKEVQIFRQTAPFNLTSKDETDIAGYITQMQSIDSMQPTWCDVFTFQIKVPEKETFFSNVPDFVCQSCEEISD